MKGANFNFRLKSIGGLCCNTMNYIASCDISEAIDLLVLLVLLTFRHFALVAARFLPALLFFLLLAFLVVAPGIRLSLLRLFGDGDDFGATSCR